MMLETIPWKLLQGIALVQLYREEKWVEPPELETARAFDLPRAGE